MLRRSAATTALSAVGATLLGLVAVGLPPAADAQGGAAPTGPRPGGEEDDASLPPPPPPPTVSGAGPGLGAGPTIVPGPDPFAGLSLPERPFSVSQLDNGLTVVVEEDRRRPRVGIAVDYGVGTVDDPEGFEGLAHLVEHLMFQGSRHLPEDRIFRELELAGATDVNASTTRHRTVYFAEVPRRGLERVLWLESDRMAFVLDHLNRETLANQQRVVRAEWRQKVGASPVGTLSGRLLSALFPQGHPYRRQPHGEPDGRAELDQVRWFIQRHYRPENAIVSLVGDVGLAEGQEMVARWFGDVRGVPGVRMLPLPPDGTRPPPGDDADGGDGIRPPQRLVLDAPVGNELLILAWPSPSWQAPFDAALDYAAALLAGAPETELRRRLRTDGVYPREVTARQYSDQLASYFAVAILGSDESRPRQTLPALAASLRRLATVGPTAAEMRWARGLWVRTELVVSERLVHRAAANAHLVRLRGIDRPADAHELDRYRSVDASEVREAVRRFLSPARATEIQVRPNPRAPTGGVLRFSGPR